MEKCSYCEIVEGKQYCHKIWEDDNFLAFLSIFPNTDGFTILITKEHHPAYIFDLPEEVIHKFITAAKTVAKLLDTKLDDVGRTGLVVDSTGIDHAHIKLIPMHGTANINKWKPTIAYLDKYFKKYEGYLSSHDSIRKDDKELEKMAKKIRLQ